jgi:hypothetical protein
MQTLATRSASCGAVDPNEFNLVDVGQHVYALRASHPAPYSVWIHAT